MSAFAEILQNIIDAERILDQRIERIETQLALLNAKVALAQRSLDTLQAKMVTKGIWEHVRAPEIKSGSESNSDPLVALPSTEELVAGLDRIIK